MNVDPARMQFPTAGEANRYLVARIQAQAELDGVTLSPLEEHALIWPDCDHTIGEDEELDEQFWKGTAPEELAQKVSSLVWRAYQRDRSADPRSTLSYRAAYRQLRRSEYFLAGTAGEFAGRGPWANALRCGVLYGLGFAVPILLASRFPTKSDPDGPLSLQVAASVAGAIFVLLFGAYASFAIAGLRVTRWGDVEGSRRQIYLPLAVFLAIAAAIAVGLTIALY